MDDDLIPMAELKKIPGELLKKYSLEKLQISVRAEMIKQEAVKERFLPRVKEIRDMSDDFTREWLADEFEWQHPEFRQACANLEVLKKLFVTVEASLKGKIQ